MKSLRVADLFCGGGGISEGLRLAGFEIVYGLDNNKTAVDTFNHNHPRAQTVKSSIEDIDIASIPEFDVLVGGPPCVEFSASKQGRGNILQGLKLVQAFLRVVHVTKPKYWIMENVPKIVLHLPDKIPLEWIGIESAGFLDVPNRGEFNAADFGVPQARKRFLMGRFPSPAPTHHDPGNGASFGQAKRSLPWVCLSEVLGSLPSPLYPKPKGGVSDLNYGFSLPIDRLADHFHEVALSDGEVRSLRKAKEAHPFMGWMPFPDKTDRPARTVVATQLGRETLIIGESVEGVDIYRRATVRECAVIQSYPNNYQFLGSHLAARYRVVGNGVPPLLVYHIGREICRDARRSVPRKPKIKSKPVELSPPILLLNKKPVKKYKKNRKFSELVPGKEVRGCRVELVNQGINPKPAPGFTESSKHLCEWKSRLTVGEGKGKTNQQSFALRESISFVTPLVNRAEYSDKFNKLICFIEKSVAPFLSDASTLQSVWCEMNSDSIHPYDVVEKLSEAIDRFFPQDVYRDVFLHIDAGVDWLPKKGVRLRLAVALFATAYCCEIINKGRNWAEQNSEKRHVDPSWKPSQRKCRFDHESLRV